MPDREVLEEMIEEALSYPFFRRALLAGLLAAVACGIVGSLVVVRRIASISGGLSHAAFGGVGLGFLLGFDPLLGALGFGVASALAIGVAEIRLQQGMDTLIAMIWAVGMALGITFVSLAPGEPPDLLGYLFGNILLVSPKYLLLVLVLDLLIVAIVTSLFRKLRAISFDEEFAWVIGVPVAPLLLLLLTLVALTVVILIRVVGVILVIALLTIPAAIARRWTDQLARMMVLATAIGAFSIVLGLFLTYGLSAGYGVELPTGPAIILLAAILFALSAAGRFVRIRVPGDRG
ncbi:MAG: metal ABC transporter permease [marine benthic group bacterium]|nr:metal ABC transporter permease [Gemmatimonadota bacterium]